MYIKITRSGDKSYVQLAQSYRNEQGKPRQRVVANLGRLDESSSQANAILAALLKASGQPAGNTTSLLSTAQFEAARSLGDVWALTVIWKQLGLDRLRQVLGQRSRHRIDLEALLRLMVMNRLCDADSKLGTLRWAQTVSLPDMALDAVSHQHLLRAMDALVEHKDVIDQVLADAVRPLVNDELSVVFYDMTTIRTEGLTDAETICAGLANPRKAASGVNSCSG